MPIGTVACTADDIIANGRVTRPRLGVAPAPAATAAALRAPAGGGAMVLQVERGSPADAAGILAVRRGLAGLAPGDVIVRLGDVRVRGEPTLQAALEALSPGDVEVELVRDVGLATERTMTVTVQLAAPTGQ